MKRILLFIAISVLSVNVSAELVLSSGPQPAFATDIFGDASVSVGNISPVDLTLSGSTIDAGNVVDITYVLQNVATFASAITTANFTAIDSGQFNWRIKAGGFVGADSVTVEVTTSAIIADSAGLRFLPGRLVSLSALGAAIGRKIDIMVTIAPITATTSNPFPTLVPFSKTTIATSKPGLTVTPSAGAIKKIALTDRTVILGDQDEIDHDNNPNTLPIVSLNIGSLDLIAEGTTIDSLGKPFTVTGSGSGVVSFLITGKFNPGDTLCVKVTPSDLCISAPTTSNTGSFATTTAKSESVEFYYVPSGGGSLTGGTYTVTAALIYDSPTHQNDLYDPITFSTALEFEGLNDDGSALAIPGSQSADAAFVRVTNVTNATTLLFGVAYTQTGEELGLEEMAVLAPNETRIFTQLDIENIFGTWEGRVRIEFMTDGDITVQTMVRSGGILNNITGSTGTTSP